MDSFSFDPSGNLLLDWIPLVVVGMLGARWFQRRNNRPSPISLIVVETLAERERLRGYVAAMGFDVEVECNGSRGVDRALNRRFDVIILSSKLPILSGKEVHQLLNQTGNKTPRILLCSKQEAEGIDQPKYLAVLSPPLEFEMLRECLLRLLPQHSAIIDSATAPAESYEQHIQTDLMDSLERRDYQHLSELIQQLREETPFASHDFHDSLDKLYEMLGEDDELETQVDEIRQSVKELATWTQNESNERAAEASRRVRSPK